MKPIQDLMARPSKQFRGQLVKLAYRLTSGTGTLSLVARERCDILANVAELIHAGSLLVDDIQDGSSMRRGAPALHLRYGVSLALNAGNWLYFWPFELIKKSGLSKERRRPRLRTLPAHAASGPFRSSAGRRQRISKPLNRNKCPAYVWQPWS